MKLAPLIVRCGHARLLGNDDLMHSPPRCGLVVVVVFVGGGALGALTDVRRVESKLLVACVTILVTITHIGLCQCVLTVCLWDT